MGFRVQQPTLGADYGLIYTQGAAKTIKFNAKKGHFAELAGSISWHHQKVQLIKDVRIQNAILFPLEGKDEPKAYEWMDVYYVDKATGEVCHTIFKTYSLPSWNQLQREIVEVAKKLNVEPSSLDYTDFTTHMVIEEHEFKGESRYVLRFYIATDKEGNPCSVLDKQGNYKDEVVVDRIDAESEEYKKVEKFVTENHEVIYDTRLVDEYAQRNFKAAYDSMEAGKKNLFVAACGARLGYYSKETAKAIAQPKADIDLLG